MATSQINKVLQHLRSALLLPPGVEPTDEQLLECFVERREPAALEALLRRHGPMAWGVCRRVLGNHHDAEDAFQATFLVLVRRAASIYPRGNVGNWLHGVAHQTALKARTTRAKRHAREQPLTERVEPAVPEPNQWSDLQPLLDQEVSRLPEKYRTVLVLCELEGLTGREAARQLGLPEGTVASRLSRARTMLARRLARHGLPLSGGALATMLAQTVVSACVPTSVMAITTRAATSVASGPLADLGGISVQVAALMEGVLKSMLLNKLKNVTMVLLVLVFLGFGATAFTQLALGAKPSPYSEKE